MGFRRDVLVCEGKRLACCLGRSLGEDDHGGAGGAPFAGGGAKGGGVSRHEVGLLVRRELGHSFGQIRIERREDLALHAKIRMPHVRTLFRTLKP